MAGVPREGGDSVRLLRTAGLVGLGLAGAILAARPCGARGLLRSYITFNGGIDVLNTNLDGDVVRDRVAGLVEIGLGYQLRESMLLEGTYGWLGRHEQQGRILFYPVGMRLPSDEERTFRVTVNPFLLRLRYAPSGHRTGYFKSEWSLGLGAYQVTRLLRNYVSVPPEEASQLLPAVELGAAALFVFDKNFMGYVGNRYTVMQHRGIVDHTRSFDGLAVLLGFRIFLPSPRDEGEVRRAP